MVTVPRPTDPVTLTTSTGTYTVFDAVTTGLLCLESMRVNGEAFLALPNNINIYAVGNSKLILVEGTQAFNLLFDIATPVYVGGLLQFQFRATAMTLPLGQALIAAGMIVSALVYDNASLTLAGVPMQIFDVNYKASSALGQGSGTNDTSPLIYSYGLVVSDPRIQRRWAAPLTPSDYLNAAQNAQYAVPAGSFNFLTTPDASGNLVSPNSYLRAAGQSVTVGWAFWYTGTPTSFWTTTNIGGYIYMAWDGTTGQNTNCGLFFTQVWANQRIELSMAPTNINAFVGVQQAQIPTTGQKVYVLWTYTRGSASNTYQFGMYNSGTGTIQPLTLSEGTNPATSTVAGPWECSTPSNYNLTYFAFFGPVQSSQAAVMAYGNFVISPGVLTFAQAFPGATT